MILDKDGCSAVDLFLVFLQISGENPKKTIVRCTSSLMASNARGRTHLADEFVTCSNHPRGQGMGRAEESPGAFQNMISRFPAHLN